MIRGVLDELKKRSVVRVAGLYAVGGWAVFQVVNALFPALGLEPWLVRAAALIFLAGFPVAIALAWMFEITPDGIKLVPGAQRQRFGRGRFGWIDWTIAAVVVAVFSFSIVQLANLRNSDGRGIASALAGVPAKSVAVLPFASFSEVRGDGYFADGLTEEVINSLAQSPDLKVAGRTSSFYFKGRNLDLREVGRKLGVAHVVEGSVRRSGETLRVTAQLIKVDDGFHLWSQTFDRDEDDVLAIQTEVADAVAQNLKTKLGDQEEPDPATPADYRAALIATAQLRTNDVDELRSARAGFAALREREPGNAAFHAGFAQATIFLAQNFLALPFDQAQREASGAIDAAIKADPRSAEAWRAKGAYERVMSIRTGEGAHEVQALDAFRKAYQLDRRDPDTMILLANQLVSAGQTDQALALVRQALSTDPLSRVGQEVLAWALTAEGKYAEARRAFETLLSLYPDYTSAATSLSTLLLFKTGQLDDAVRLLDDPKMSADDPINAILLSSAYANMGMAAEANQALDRIQADSPAGPIAHAAALQLAGKKEELLTFAIQEGKRTGDPIWNSVQVAGTTLIGEYGAARAAIPANYPGLMKTPPEVGGYRAIDILLSATAVQRSGGEAEAKAILEALLARMNAARSQAADDLVSRGMTLAALGRTDEAVAVFESAFAAGWRTPIEFDYFVRIDQFPFMAETARDPRFRKVMADMEADLARMRDNVVKWRESRRPPG
ncbi:MAG TPA: tetratricopeptide repeat protein [Allosphingosinicella sp.]